MSSAVPFIPGDSPPQPGPFSRYLPPLPQGIAKAWLAEHLSPEARHEGWVLDPFGASPSLVLEAAQAGCRVLVTANNPVARFLIEMAANPPAKADFLAALAELSTSSRGEERMEQHIRSLYNTECAVCGATVMAEAFFWERQAPAPYARQYQCTSCNAKGEFPATNQDAARAQQFTTVGLHRARALERVAPPNDPDRIHAEEALSVYLPRSVYALFTLINKMDGLRLPPARRRALEALLLRACDLATTMWQVPTARERPRQLTIPPRFRENNLWLSLESGIDAWASLSSSLPLTIYPEAPPDSGGICLFEGRLRDLCDQIRTDKEISLPIKAVLTALPRPNQAFWTLSALWAGWLWGREAAAPFKGVLRRRRYDWNWHTAGLFSAFSSLAGLLPPDVPILGLIGEAETGFLTAALVGADMAGLNLTGLALRSGTELAQLHWQTARQDRQDRQETISRDEADRLLRQAAANAIEQFLKIFGAPAGYLLMYTAGLEGIVQSGVLRRRALQPPKTAPELPSEESLIQEEVEASPPDQFSYVQNAIRDVISFRGGYLRYGATDSPETGFWWLRSPEGSAPPLPDQVEKFLVTRLVRQGKCRFFELSRALLREFAGLRTPPVELIQVCLESYAAQSPTDPDEWELRPQEIPAARRQDLEMVTRQLVQLAELLEYTTEGKFPLKWLDAHGNTQYWFYPIASAVIGDLILGKSLPSPSPGERSIIVLPGSRANLVAYKLRHDSRLRQLCATREAGSPDAEQRHGWRFVKYRQVRSLLESPLLRREKFDDLLNLDPLTYAAPQMRLF